MKKCSKKDCPIPVEHQRFGIRKTGQRKGKQRSQCLDCERKQSDLYKGTHKEQCKKQQKGWRKNNGVKHNENYYFTFDLNQPKTCIGLKCQNRNKTYNDFYRNKGNVDGFSDVCKECKWAYDLNIKQQFVNGYGGKCACCGETEIRFLTIEHKNRDGKSHRKENPGQCGMYMNVIKNNFPDKYTVLCYNCNCSQNMGRKCPHEEKKLCLVI